MGNTLRRQPVPGGQPADDPGDRHRHPLRPVRGPERGGVEELPRGGRERQGAPVPLHPVPIRHADADPRRRRRVPQALDPARHARRHPRPAGEQDQLRLRDRRREADRPHDRGLPRASTSTRWRSSTSTASASSSTRSAGVKVEPPDRRLLDRLGGAFNLKLKKGEHTLNGFQAITLARTRENTCGDRPDFTGTDIERAQFQQLILDGIRGRLTTRCASPTTSSRARSSAGTRPRRWSRAWARGRCPSSCSRAVIGFSKGTDVLKPSATTAAGNLIIPPEECAARGEEVPRLETRRAARLLAAELGGRQCPPPWR